MFPKTRYPPTPFQTRKLIAYLSMAGIRLWVGIVAEEIVRVRLSGKSFCKTSLKGKYYVYVADNFYIVQRNIHRCRMIDDLK